MKQLPVKRQGHAFRGFPSLIPILYLKLPHKHYAPGEYIRQPTSNSEIGNVDYSKEEKYIVCNDGVIVLLSNSSSNLI